MWRHNLKITFRKFQRNSTSFLINLIGLSTGLACALFIFLWVNDELKVDRFHENDSRLYQVMHNLPLPGGHLTEDSSPTPLANELIETMPEVEFAVCVNDFFNWEGKKGTLSQGEKKLEVKGIHAQEDFFKVFTYPLIAGDKNHILLDKSGIILSKSTAKKLFGTTQNIIGKTLDWQHVAYNGTFQVAGIFEDPPTYSTLQFDVIFHFSHLLENDRWSGQWNGDYGKTYFVLKEGADIQLLNNKIEWLLKEKIHENVRSTLSAVPYSSQYLYGEFKNGTQTGEGRITYVNLFSLIALLIILIACVNFMNLSTAESSLKMKEIGVKKTIGASRSVLIKQLLGESMVLALLAFVFAAALIGLLLPQFNHISGKALQLNWTPTIILTGLSITILTGIIAGSYPAFYLSGFRPVMVLKGKLKTFMGEVWIRKGLVVFQFSLSLLFIIALLVINEQLEFAQNKNLGYDRDNIISFKWKGAIYDDWNGLREGKSNDNFFAFLAELKNVSGVENATTMAGNILDNVIKQSGASWTGDETEREFMFESPLIGYDFMETLGIELLEGRSFAKGHNDHYHRIVLNQAAVDMMKLENPVGQTINMNGGECEIIGVVKNFHYGSLYNPIEPLIFRYDLNKGNILAKIQRGATKETIERIQALQNKFFPGQTLEYSFLDEDYQRQYEAEIRVAALSKYFAGLAIIISCLGLFGLAMFTAERRKKEISIRKVLGANLFGIIQLLSKEFITIVIIAVLLALPIGYLGSKNWLDNFVYSIELKGWYFIAPALTILLIAWVTVGMQTYRAARRNPVESLKME